MEFFEALFTIQGLTYFIILSLLEIVLGIDNIIFISIVTDKLEKTEQRKARNLGLGLALAVRLILLAFVSWIMQMTGPLFPNTNIELLQNFSIQSLVLFLGGLFLIYKSTHEMHSSVKGHHVEASTAKKNLRAVIVQIILIDIVFSFDSIITAIGMTNELQRQTGHDPLVIIYAAVIVSILLSIMCSSSI